MATRSDYAYYPKLWHKAWLVEIINKKNNQLLRSFAFSLPPESESISIGQRVNEKKTFGGLFVDDYGVDVASIELSGSTGNSQFREIFRNEKAEYVDGKTEATIILEELVYWKNNLVQEDYEMRLYDLSASGNDIQTQFDTTFQVRANGKASGWLVILKDVKFSRSKEKPFFYNYSIQFTGIRPLGRKYRKFSGAYSSPAIERVYQLIDKVKSGSAALKKTLAAYKSVLDYISVMDQVLNSLESEVREYYNTVQGFISATASAENAIFSIMSFPADLTSDLLAASIEVRDQVEELWEYTIDGAWDDLETRYERTKDLWHELWNIVQTSADLHATAKSIGELPEVEVVPADIEGSTTTDNPTLNILLTYGSRSVIATSETRLDTLAYQEYGDAEYANTIAVYNEISGDSDIYPGMILQIPYLSYVPSIEDNEIYTLNEGEILGSDIALSPSGDLLLAENGDFAVKDGQENIIQSIALRLEEELGARLRIEDYGIRDISGSVDSMSLSLFITSIQDTLVSDPRINRVYDFYLKQNGDTISFSFSIDLVNGSVEEYTKAL